MNDTTTLTISDIHREQVELLLGARGEADAWDDNDLEVVDVMGLVNTCLIVRVKR